MRSAVSCRSGASREVLGGVAFDALLRRCQLDDSLASLDRIDTLLDALHRTQQPQPQAFLKDAPQRNMVLLLALHAGHAAAELSYLPLVSSKTLDWVALLDAQMNMVGWAPVDGF